MSKNIIDLMQDRAWALHPGKLDEINTFVQKRANGPLSKEEIEAVAGKSGQANDDPYQVQDGIAIIPVYGVISKRMNLFSQFSGGTSTELLQKNIQKALDDPDIAAIVLDVDSPGGSVDGTKEVADFIMQSREQKPIIAYANGLMASAAYWIGSAAESLVAFDTAEVGSIGVALTHYDYSEADRQAGVKRTVIYAGKYKRIASDKKPLTEEGKNHLQDYVDQYYGMFVQAVADQRGSDVETVLATMADGKIFIGSAAKANGLVDHIGSLNSAINLAKLLGGVMDVKTLQEKHADVYQQVFNLGAASIPVETLTAEALALGTAAERSRVTAILACDAQDAAKKAAIEQGVTVEAAYKLFFEAEKARKDDALVELAKMAPKPVGATETETVQIAKKTAFISVEEEAEAEYRESADLQKEFRDFKTYLAFKKADAKGLVRMKEDK